MGQRLSNALRRFARIRGKPRARDCTTCKVRTARCASSKTGSSCGPSTWGTDPTKAFTVDESGKLVPNKQRARLRTEPREGGASNVTAVGGDMALGKTAQGKVDEGLLDTSAALMRWSASARSIGRNGQPREARRNGIPVHSGKLGGKLDAGETEGTLLIHRGDPAHWTT